MGRKAGGWYQYSGAIHMHTTESDGTLPIQDVIAIGRSAGLDFMLFTDHMTLSNREAGHEGFYGDTLALIGYEHNDLDDKNHYLIFDSPKVYPADMTAREYVAAGAHDGALGILAHPDEQRDQNGRYPPYPWLDWDMSGYNAIELWNQMSEWMERLTPYNRVAMAFSPRKSMVAPTARILRKWDDINMTRKCAGIVGVDAHAFPIKVGPFTIEIFPYKVHFRSLRSHLLLPEPLSRDLDIARKQVYGAIRDCRIFGSNLRWGDAAGFEFIATQKDKQVTMGGELNGEEDAIIAVRLPAKGRIRLICNGEPLLETQSDRLDYHLQNPGLYRVEVWKKKRCWIFSNHIRIGVSTE